MDSIVVDMWNDRWRLRCGWSRLAFILLLLALPANAKGETSATLYSGNVIKAQWTAHWIWATSGGMEPNTHVYFRRDFVWTRFPRSPFGLTSAR